MEPSLLKSGCQYDLNIVLICHEGRSACDPNTQKVTFREGHTNSMVIDSVTKVLSDLSLV